MALAVTHGFVSAIADDASASAAGEVLPSHWNAAHTLSGTIDTAQISNDAVTYAKIQNVSATDRLLGRDTAAAGDVEELTVGGGLEFTGSSGIQTSALTGDVTKTAGGTVTTIANDAVTYAKIQNVSATSRFLGRITAGAGDVEELTGTQATTLLDAFTAALKGLAPASGGGTTNFLRADGTWAAPGGATAPLDLVLDNAVNNAVSTILTLTHTTSGAPAIGIGSGMNFVAETSAANNEIGAVIEAVTTDVTAASEDFDLVFKTMAAGAAAAERMRIGSTGTVNVVTALTVNSTAVALTGKQSVPVPASSMTTNITNGAAAGTIEMTTNDNMVVTFDFDATTSESVQFSMIMPISWNEGTITFQPVWSHPATVTNFGVVWQLSAVAVSDDDPLDVAFGTGQTSTDTGGTTNDLYIGPESSAITVGGTPQAGDYVMFKVARLPANASDTMAVDARLHAIRLNITTAAGNDA